MALAPLGPYTGKWETIRSVLSGDLRTLVTALNTQWSGIFDTQNRLALGTAVTGVLAPPHGGSGGWTVLQDAAILSVTPALGTVFYVEAGGNRTVALVPITDVIGGQTLVIAHKAIGGANRTLTLTTTGGAGSFRFGTTIAGLSATTAGLTDYIICTYNPQSQTWDVVDYKKGF